MNGEQLQKIANDNDVEFVILYYWSDSSTHLVRSFDVAEHISAHDGNANVNMFNAITHDELS